MEKIQAFRLVAQQIEQQHPDFFRAAPCVGTTTWSRPARLTDYTLLTYDSYSAHLGLLPTLPAPIAAALRQAFRECMR